MWIEILTEEVERWCEVYHNRHQIRITHCYVYKYAWHKFQNQMPMSAELLVIFRKHLVLTLPTHLQNIVVHLKKKCDSE